MKHFFLVATLLVAVSAVQANPDSAAMKTIATVSHQKTLQISGKPVSYTVTAGHLEMLRENGTVRARIFYTSYVRSSIPANEKRAITFSFNGGPGSSSVWLHLGVLGPRKVRTNADGSPPAPPADLVDNPHSWLDLTDMVFIDPVSTGFSRADDDKNAKDFHGFRQDIESVGEFIRTYVSQFHRWGSPKYLIGESYGTTRASALANHLQQQHGMYLNGVILVSAVLNFQTLDIAAGNDLPYALFLPSFTAAAWNHKKLAPADQALPLTEILDLSRTFAMQDYTVALMKGATISASEEQRLVDNLKRFTGLSADYIRASNYRIVIYKFCQELLRNERKIIGRFDALFTGHSTNALAEEMERDPSHHPTIGGSFATAINQYLRSELGVTTHLPYEVLTGRVHPWDYTNVQNEYLNVAPRLREAMVQNPELRVWIANGYTDLATPFFATEYTVNHMALPRPLATNVTQTYYNGGHMMYLADEHLQAMKQHAIDFYK
jgi:carboxypeptidase C (cathepsin A)